MRHRRKSNDLRPFRHTVTARCQVVRDRDFTLVADRIQDLSVGGALVTPADPVLTGESVWLSFRLPGATDWVDVEAVVARVCHGRRPGESSRSLGLELVSLDAPTRRLLARHLARLPPAPPRPRPGRRRTSAAVLCLAQMSGHTALPPT